MQLSPTGLYNNSKIIFGSSNVTLKNTSASSVNLTNSFDTFSYGKTKEVLPRQIPQNCEITLKNFNDAEKDINSTLQSIKMRFDLVTQEAQEMLRQAKKSYKSGCKMTPEGALLTKITGTGNQRVMEEFCANGNLLRRITLTNNNGDILCVIEEGFETLKDGTKKIARKAGFINQEPIWYAKNHQISADGSERFEKKVDFRFMQPSYYVEGYERRNDGTLKRKLEVDCRFKKLAYFCEGFESKNGELKREKEIYFQDGKASYYQEGFTRRADGSVQSKKTLKRTKKGWIGIMK